ncbi:MAG: NADH-quinone oxidoreductase subunit L [Acidobacteria bacterium]|nr:NADH-quinone oxidoreductase subunit L [Acidobacteriota bacterium]
MLALIPLLPFLGFLVNASLGRRLPRAMSGGLASAVMVAAFAIAVTQVMALAGLPEGSREINQTLFTWITSGDFTLDLSFRLDPLSAVMVLVITGIGSLIHIYSTAYMSDETDSEFARFFSYLNLFVFFMLLLVLGSNFLVMFVGWEGVGLCSYLLIGFYYVKKAAGDASKKAFIVNRVGDYAFIIGSLLALVTFGSLDFQIIAAKVTAMAPEAAFGTLSLITLLLFVGATGKSAQIPLYTWLPDAMEGPTPVSALIHAATMVTAGVYMIGRNAVLFEHAPITLGVVAAVGAATALFAGTIGLVQNDIKRVLAYSTVSQLGYMFLAMGVGAFGAGIFHLYTHAFFKACLFLGSGAVIHALHGEQDIRHMGGLKKGLPITYWTFLVASIAIAGVPFLSGFFSKDEILFETFAHGHQVLWVIGAVTSLLTATYMFRLVFLTFHGERRMAPAAAGNGGHGHDDHAAHGHAGLHDAPPAMALALVVLAVGSVFAGYIGVPHALGGHNTLGEWLKPSFAATSTALAACNVPVALPGAPAGMTLAECAPGDAAPALASSAQTAAERALPASAQAAELQEAPAGGEHGLAGAEDQTALELLLMGVSSLIALLGIGLAAFLWLKNPHIPASLATQFPGLHTLLLNKYYVDEIYDAAIVHPIKTASTEGLWKVADARIIDGAVNVTGCLVAGVSAVLRLFQTGSVRSYAASTLVGVVVILGYYLWR